MSGVLDPEAERRLAEGAERLRLAVEAGDPEVIEDLLSIAESSPFLVRVAENPLPCARCGAYVARVRESAYSAGQPRQWVPAIWETFNGRKHTIRRCEAMQAGTATGRMAP